MTDHKFTDNDVIKALECCKGEDIPCKSCPYFDLGSCESAMAEDALALINRQMRELDDLKRDTIPKLQNGLERANYYGLKADEEIEHLKAEIESLQAVNADMTESLRLAAEANKDMSVELNAMRGAANSYKMHYENAKAEAIKEFAEAVKIEFYREFDEVIPSVMADKIDTLVKEMTEETK